MRGAGKSVLFSNMEKLIKAMEGAGAEAESFKSAIDDAERKAIEAAEKKSAIAAFKAMKSMVYENQIGLAVFDEFDSLNNEGAQPKRKPEAERPQEFGTWS